MNPLILSLLAIVLLLAAALWFTIGRKSRWESFANNALIVNITAKGRDTVLADASFTSRYLIAKRGSTPGNINICTASDLPLGVVPDMTPTQDQANSDLSYPLPIHYFGLNEDTERVIAAAAIAQDAFIVPAAAGQVKTLPTSGGGTTYVIGKANTAAVAQGDQVEMIPCFPYLVAIPS